MRRIELGILLAVGLAASCTTQAWAQPGPPPHGPDLLRAAQAAGLSSAQVAQIKKIAIAAQREIIPLQAKLKLAQLDLQEAVEGDSVPAEKKVIGLVEKVGYLETQMKKNNVLMMVRIRSTMGKAQWDKLQALQAQQRARPGGPPPPPRP